MALSMMRCRAGVAPGLRRRLLGERRRGWRREAELSRASADHRIERAVVASGGRGLCSAGSSAQGRPGVPRRWRLAERGDVVAKALAKRKAITARAFERQAAKRFGLSLQPRVLFEPRDCPHHAAAVAIVHLALVAADGLQGLANLCRRGLAGPLQNSDMPVELPGNGLALGKHAQLIAPACGHFVAPGLDLDTALAPGPGQGLPHLVQGLALDAQFLALIVAHADHDVHMGMIRVGMQRADIRRVAKGLADGLARCIPFEIGIVIGQRKHQVSGHPAIIVANAPFGGEGVGDRVLGLALDLHVGRPVILGPLGLAEHVAQGGRRFFGAMTIRRDLDHRHAGPRRLLASRRLAMVSKNGAGRTASRCRDPDALMWRTPARRVRVFERVGAVGGTGRRLGLGAGAAGLGAHGRWGKARPRSSAWSRRSALASLRRWVRRSVG